ncbi:hypothetical protein C6496_13875 [Candidatus Poribacteria bacterium]|nr:MAG: hypothetical protein C6496_13875 [Candidatus Poribacteria bacterium]
MSKKMFWGVALLVILLGTAAVWFIQHERAEIQQLELDLAETEAFAKWWEQRHAAPQDASSEDPKSADGERIDVGKSDETSDHGQKANTPPDWNSLTPEQRQQIFDQFYLQNGLKPPPRGYEYRWKDEGVPLLDENGNPVLHKKGEPIVDIHMQVGFAPTLEEFKRYKQLMWDAGVAESRGDFAEAERFEAERKALEASVQRMRPFVKFTIAKGDEAISKADRVTKEKLDAALREHGLEHLISPWGY